MYDKFVEENAVKFLKLRHRLIPYIYSMNRLTESKGRCLIEPMYYENPKDERAYNCPNEYYFGTELIVCPITEKTNEKTGLAGTKAYLPKGRYTDIFTGRIYNGNSEFYIFRDKSSIPVLAKEGAIIPLAVQCDTNDISNPTDMEILISRGNNSFVLYEDDGESNDYKNGVFCETVYRVSDNAETVKFNISAATGDISVIPDKRSYKLSFIDISDAEKITVTVDGDETEFNVNKINSHLVVSVSDISSASELCVVIEKYNYKKNPPKKELEIALVSRYKCSNDKKTAKFAIYKKKRINAVVPKELRRPLAELDELIY